MTNDEETSELLPCPFCGGEAVTGTRQDDEYFVKCFNENCGGELGARGS